MVAARHRNASLGTNAWSLPGNQQHRPFTAAGAFPASGRAPASAAAAHSAGGGAASGGGGAESAASDAYAPQDAELRAALSVAGLRPRSDLSEGWKPPASSLVPAASAAPAAPADAKAAVSTIKAMVSQQHLWFTCEQLGTLLQCLQPAAADGDVQAGQHAQQARPELVVALFGRMLDMENMWDTLLQHLSESQRAILVTRIGPLNLLNPMRPDGHYRLDLEVYEQWRVAFVLVKLASCEGETAWRGVMLNGQPFELPMSWVTVGDAGAGIPRSGVLALTFVSERPNTRVRHELSKWTLLAGHRAVRNNISASSEVAARDVAAAGRQKLEARRESHALVPPLLAAVERKGAGGLRVKRAKAGDGAPALLAAGDAVGD
jgi:hypothetical protein